jgi:hypothetical protein
MSEIENLINDLQKENERLSKELEGAEENIRDFEVLAIEWKKGYEELRLKHQVEMANLKQTIKELENESQYDLEDAAYQTSKKFGW